MRHFSDSQLAGPRQALKAAGAKLAGMETLPGSAPRRQGELAKTAEKG